MLEGLVAHATTVGSVSLRNVGEPSETLVLNVPKAFPKNQVSFSNTNKK